MAITKVRSSAKFRPLRRNATTHPPPTVRPVGPAWHDPPVVFVFVLAGIAILGAVALVASGSGDGLEPVATDRPGPWVPPDRAVSGDDVRQVRFGVALRGYRMSEVDQLLDRLASEIALRDELIDELESQGRPVPTRPQQTEPRTDA